MSAAGQVTDLFIAARRGSPIVRVPHLHLIAHQGIVDDRYGRGEDHDPDREVTLMELEQVDYFRAQTGINVTPGDFRRNIIVRNVDLNALVGQTFQIGNTRLLGTELCEPCRSIGERLREGDWTPARIVKLMTGRGGLCARIISGGTLAEGDRLTREAGLD